MTPVRALLASLFATVLVGAGAFIAASLAGGRPHDLVPLLALGRNPFSLWCFLAAWGAIVFGVFGILAAFLAFIAPEEDDDPRFRRRGFPKGAPIILIAAALFLVWFALRCAGEEAATPIAAPVEPGPAAPPETALLGDADEIEAPTISTPPASPKPAAEATSFQWPYKYPPVNDGSDLRGRIARSDGLFADDAESRRLLCGKAWVAATGSSSQEGPAERNRIRASMRAAAAQRAAENWLKAHADCGQTVVLGVDLGQHAQTAGGDGGGAATAYQRQTLIVSRARAGDGDVTAGEATGELRAFLDDPASRAALYAGRDFPSEPVILPAR